MGIVVRRGPFTPRLGMVGLALSVLLSLIACSGQSTAPAGTPTPTPANGATATVQAVTVEARAATAQNRTATAGVRNVTATILATAQPTTAARAATLAATQTAAANDPAATASFAPAAPSPRVATAAAATISPATPTLPGTTLPKEGTPFSIPSATGDRVLVGERRLWISCRGEGGPTVVMDAGVNSGSQAWTLVQPGIASFTRVCVYDRAGLGRSDPIPRPRTSQEVVDDLHGLLRNAGIPGPYILVAHSFGGLNVRLYAGQFPRDVVGMVLVDTVHEDRFAATAKVLTPEQERDFERGREANPEGLDYYESSRLVRALGKPLPDFPIVVIARGRADSWPSGWPAAALEQAWRDLQSDLANRAGRGSLVIATQSDHNIPGEQPQLIVDATRRVMDRIRAGSR